MWKHIGQIEKDMGGMKTNYVSRFETMHEAMHNIKTETLTAIHELELNVRQSVHGLREDLAKFLGKMEARENDGVH